MEAGWLSWGGALAGLFGGHAHGLWEAALALAGHAARTPLADLAQHAAAFADALTGHLHFDTLAPGGAGARGSAPAGTAAATPGMGTQPTFLQITDPAFLNHLLTAVRLKGLAIMTSLLFDGQVLVNLLMVMIISWKGIKLALGASDINEVLGELLQVIILWGVVFWFLSSAGSYTTLCGAVIQGFDYIAAKVSGLQFQPGQPPDALFTAFQQLVMASEAIFKSIGDQFAGAVSNDFGSSALAKWFTSTSIGHAIATADVLTSPWLLFKLLIDALFKVIVAFLLLLCGIMLFALFMASQMLIFIAIALGPILIPWLVWDVADSYFHSWFKFLLVAGMYRVMGILIMGLAAPILNIIIQDEGSIGAGTGIATIVENDLALVATGFFLLWLFRMAPEWANEIFTGTPNARLSNPSVAGAVSRETQRLAGMGKSFKESDRGKRMSASLRNRLR